MLLEVVARKLSKVTPSFARCDGTFHPRSPLPSNVLNFVLFRGWFLCWWFCSRPDSSGGLRCSYKAEIDCSPYRRWWKQIINQWEENCVIRFHRRISTFAEGYPINLDPDCSPARQCYTPGLSGEVNKDWGWWFNTELLKEASFPCRYYQAIRADQK